MQTESEGVGAVALPERDVRSLLRDATMELHTAIEATAAVRRVMSKTVTEADYQNLLVLLHGFHTPLEQRLDTFCRRQAEPPPYKRRRTRLEGDLRQRGLDPDRLPRCTGLPCPRNRAELLGIAWVVEGSALGAQVIRRHLEASLDPSIIGPYHAEEDPAVWRAFLGRLEDGVRTRREQREAVDAARSTFQVLLRWLEAGPT